MSESTLTVHSSTSSRASRTRASAWTQNSSIGGSSDTEQRVLKALEGRTLVILGGLCKPHAKAALIRDLRLKDIDWIESSEYDHGQHAASRLRDPDVACVIFALRWAAHAHGSIRNAAWALGIPAVSLPGGYNPRQVLHQLSVQISDKLTA